MTTFTRTSHQVTHDLEIISPVTGSLCDPASVPAGADILNWRKVFKVVGMYWSLGAILLKCSTGLKHLSIHRFCDG